MSKTVCLNNSPGFSLIELMMSLVILTFGLLAIGQLLYTVASASSLARSKSVAAVVAKNKIESLADLYSRDPLAADLGPGNHGPLQTQVVNPIDGTILNQYDIGWTVANVEDPRPGKVVGARLVRVTISPIQSGGAGNSRPAFNKIVSIASILSPKTS